jgi:hypothetical protein
MKLNLCNLRLFVLSACMALVIAWSVPAPAESPILLISPSRFWITEWYDGGDVYIAAEIPRGAQAVVELKGPAHEDDLVLKDRRWGLWMSVGEIEVDHAPSLYLVMTSHPKLLSKQDPEDRWGYDALRKRVRFSGAAPTSGVTFLFDQFIKLQESQGLYGIFPGALKKLGTHGDFVKVEGHFTLPGNLKPDTYMVSLSVLNNGKIIQQRSVAFPVRMKNVAAFLSDLAYRHGTIYGLFAVAIAMMAGFLMGHLFKGKHAH